MRPRPAVALADHEAGHRPDAVVVLVLVPTAPRDARGAQLGVRRPRFDRDPACRIIVDVGHQPARGTSGRVAAGGLRLEHRGPLLQGGVAPEPADDLEPLALAPACVVGGAEDRDEVVARGLVGRDDGQLLGRDRRLHGRHHGCGGSSPTRPPSACADTMGQRAAGAVGWVRVSRPYRRRVVVPVTNRTRIGALSELPHWDTAPVDLRAAIAQLKDALRARIASLRADRSARCSP